MLFGAAVMIALMADGDDDAGLIVVPAMGGDPGALAQFRARAVGGDQQARLDDAAVGRASRRRRRLRESKAVTAVARRSMPSASARVDQRVDQMAVLDHMRERLARLDIAAQRSETPDGSRLPVWNR